ncbi:hypothetical protein GQ54DRAFT_125570 [Martensiomyces pterosporus]|nr:hypothetical protein GQ54DRAFT_125570 [Martensiomyces pterosporus]
MYWIERLDFAEQGRALCLHLGRRTARLSLLRPLRSMSSPWFHPLVAPRILQLPTQIHFVSALGWQHAHSIFACENSSRHVLYKKTALYPFCPPTTHSHSHPHPHPHPHSHPYRISTA